MKVGGRDLGVICRAAFQRRHYLAAYNMLHVYEEPRKAFGDYLLKVGEYPRAIIVRTPSGPLPLRLYSHDDLLTVNEIFCRKDYPIKIGDKIIVDFGSNIGVSAAYFLSAAPNSHVYLFEPLPMNATRLQDNLKAFQGRFSFNEAAVGLRNGTVEFGWEETGRYGGIGLKRNHSVLVQSLDSNEVLRAVIAEHGRIDVLKIDIESLEQELVERLPDDLAKNIDRIYVEFNFTSNPLIKTHTHHQYGGVAHFIRQKQR
jgi:FkbM family methyltransferase